MCAARSVTYVAGRSFATISLKSLTSCCNIAEGPVELCVLSNSQPNPHQRIGAGSFNTELVASGSC
jgi:hypothetical protein